MVVNVLVHYPSKPLSLRVSPEATFDRPTFLEGGIVGCMSNVYYAVALLEADCLHWVKLREDIESAALITIYGDTKVALVIWLLEYRAG
jgi:hypothetical protein